MMPPWLTDDRLAHVVEPPGLNVFFSLWGVQKTKDKGRKLGVELGNLSIKITDMQEFYKWVERNADFYQHESIDVGLRTNDNAKGVPAWGSALLLHLCSP